MRTALILLAMYLFAGTLIYLGFCGWLYIRDFIRSMNQIHDRSDSDYYGEDWMP